jgi:hypothetical protein
MLAATDRSRDVVEVEAPDSLSARFSLRTRLARIDQDVSLNVAAFLPLPVSRS